MIPYINVPFDYVARQLGASTDELKLISSFLLSYPLAALLKRLPDDRPRMKNIFIVSVSLFYLVGLFDLWSGLSLILFDAVTTYAIAAYIKGPYMPWVGFVFLMGHMSLSHLERQRAANPSSVDISGAQMVMVMKLSAFCWNVWDGQQDQSGLTEYQRDRALKDLPDPLDYAAFVFFFPSFMAGPAFDFADYRRWLETTMFAMPPGTDPAKAPPTRKQRKIPRSGGPAMYKMAVGLVWILAFLQMSGWYSAGVVLSSKYAHFNLPKRIWHLHMMSFVARMKYYGVWTLTEGACILAGIGYKGVDPKTGKADWSRLQNINPWGVELAQNSHAYLGNWNMNTNNWLRNYLYLRVTPKGRKPGFRASMATFVTSAFWHGFYPGYYMAFVLAAFIQNIAKNSRRLLRPMFLTADGKTPTPNKRYYGVLTWLVTQLAFSFTTAPFILLTLQDSLRVWSRVYFYCPIGVLAISLFLLTPGKAYLQRMVKERQQRPALKRDESMESLPDQSATMGVPNDPGLEWDEMVDQIMDEVKKRRGSKAGPDGKELRSVVEETLRIKGQKGK